MKSMKVGSFKGQLGNGRDSQMLLEEMSLTQLLPRAKVNCSLNLSTVSPKMQYEDTPGLLLKRGYNTVTLDCTPFSSSDTKRGVWKFNGTVSWPDEFSGSFPVTGFMWINYHRCDKDESGWCPYTFWDRYILKKCEVSPWQ